ncbi:MAG: anti-sigma factor RsbA family regulatory protein [Carbonactinosporaceae bacterium]
MTSPGKPPDDQRPAASHRGLLYASDDELLAGVLPFAAEGLREGDRVLAVTTGATMELLREQLGEDADRIDSHEAKRWHGHPPRTLAAYDDYVRSHAPVAGCVRIITEPAWSGRTVVERREWARHEALLNVAFAHSAAQIVCLYDTRSASAPVVRDCLRTHPELLEGGVRRRSANYLDPVSFNARCDTEPLPGPRPPCEQLAFSLPNLHEVRTRAYRRATVSGVPMARARGFVLAVNEVATNAIQHGGGNGHLILWCDDRSLICQISDSSGPITPPFPGHLPPGVNCEHGRGLWLARQLCELVQIRTGDTGSTVRLHISLEP